MMNLTIIIIIVVLAIYSVMRPKKGYFWRWRKSLYFSDRVVSEDVLKHLYHCEYGQRTATVQSLSGAIGIPLDKIVNILKNIEVRELISVEGASIHLTFKGREYALRVIRAHRLWERYLSEETGHSESEWHKKAERQEHRISLSEANDLAAKMGNPSYDPHGDPIPTRMGDLPPLQGQPLATLAIGGQGTIVHLEDEPEGIYAQLVAEGLHLSMVVQLIQVTPEQVCFSVEGREHVVPPIVAANVSVIPRVVEENGDEVFETLARLEPGQQAMVVRLSPNCRGLERRRLMDLGILPGTIVKAELRSPSGDPTAFQIRGALIALRAGQSSHIQISKRKRAS